VVQSQSRRHRGISPPEIHVAGSASNASNRSSGIAINLTRADIDDPLAGLAGDGFSDQRAVAIGGIALQAHQANGCRRRQGAGFSQRGNSLGARQMGVKQVCKSLTIASLGRLAARLGRAEDLDMALGDAGRRQCLRQRPLGEAGLA
jgi:hypothetical protein